MLAENVRDADGIGDRNNGKKKALIIAVSEYDTGSGLPPLPYCKNDGEAMYEVLKSQYEIPDQWSLIGRVDGDTLRRTIYEFFREKATGDDTLFFYFSGHGMHDDHSDTFLATSNIDKSYVDKNGYNFLDLENVALRKTPARNVIVALDCCLAGDIEIVGKDGTDEVTKARSNMNKVFAEGNGKCILASSLNGQSSYKMDGEDFSRFTWFLVEGLKGGNGESVDDHGYVTPSRLSNFVYYRMPQIMQQKPITKTEFSGDIKIMEYPELATDFSEQLLKLLKSGDVAKFNEKRKASGYEKLVFHLADLSEIIMNGADFSNCDLCAVNLSGLDLQRTNFSLANLENADLRNTKLQSTIFVRAKLSHANFDGADLSYARLGGAKMNHCKLRGATLTDTNLLGADLSFADLSPEPTTLESTNFNGANLDAVNLEGAKLTSAIMTNVQLRSANMSGADLTDVNFGDANLEGASLLNARIYNAKLSDVNTPPDKLRPMTAGIQISPAGDNLQVIRSLKNISEDLRRVILEDNPELRQIYEEE